MISARKRSPALRWVNPKCSTMLAHCVPFPLPGPPMRKFLVRCKANHLFKVNIVVPYYELFISLKLCKLVLFYEEEYKITGYTENRIDT